MEIRGKASRRTRRLLRRSKALNLTQTHFGCFKKLMITGSFCFFLRERREAELCEAYRNAASPEEAALVLQRYALRFTISDATLDSLKLPRSTSKPKDDLNDAAQEDKPASPLNGVEIIERLPKPDQTPLNQKLTNPENTETDAIQEVEKSGATSSSSTTPSSPVSADTNSQIVPPQSPQFSEPMTQLTESAATNQKDRISGDTLLQSKHTSVQDPQEQSQTMQLESAQSQSVQQQSSQLEPVQPQSVQVESAQPLSVQVEPAQPQSVQQQSPQSQLAHHQSTQPQPEHLQPLQSPPVQSTHTLPSAAPVRPVPLLVAKPYCQPRSMLKPVKVETYFFHFVIIRITYNILNNLHTCYLNLSVSLSTAETFFIYFSFFRHQAESFPSTRKPHTINLSLFI